MSATGGLRSARRAVRGRALAVLAWWLATSLAFAANKLPSVSITSPVSGATFAAPATIAIAANASDQDGTVVRVDFYQGTMLLATRTAAPYAFTWTGVAGGPYSLTAVAYDNTGASKTSTAVTITVTGSAITIAQPAPGATLYGLATTVSGGFAGDADSTVVVDGPFGSRLATVTANQYSAVVPLAVGPNVLRATVARRNRTSDTTSVTVVANLDPIVTFTLPASTTLDAQTPALLEADAVSPAGAIARVDFYGDGALLGSATAPPYRYTWTAPAAGSHTLMARATDDRGTSASVSLPVTVNGPNVAPAVTLTSPTPGASYTAPATVPLAATANDSDGAVARVDFLRDGAVVGTTNVAPYAMSLPGLAAGRYSLAARATDDRGASTTSAPVAVVVAPPNAPPTVTWSAPAAGARFVAPATLSLAAVATDSDGAVVRVDFLANGAQVASAASAPYAATWSNVSPGTYALAARATDNAGATATSAPVTITVVANAAPAVTLTSPLAGGEYFAPAAIALSATATDSDGAIARVEFLVDGTPVASIASPPYTATWTAAVPGTYAIAASAVDDAGAAATSSPVNVSVMSPSIIVESPADGASIDASHVHVIGTFRAQAGSGVTVNGVIAAIVGERFYAANVPLAAGANELQIVVTTSGGATTTRTLAVTSQPAPIAIDVMPTQGMAPLDVTITVTARSDVTITKIEVDALGDGTYVVARGQAPWTAGLQYLSPATVMLGVRVTDANGNVVTERVPVVAQDRAAIDQRVRAAWEGMLAGLRAGDPAKALEYLDAGARARYGPVFTTLQPQLPAIVQSFSALQGLSLTEDFGEYAINRVIDGQNRLYLIYFGLNADGVWRLGSM